MTGSAGFMAIMLLPRVDHEAGRSIEVC